MTVVIANEAEALSAKPISSHGVPIGMGDWRVAVEILLPQDPTSRWGVAKWGQSQWNGIQWEDLTPFVRGAEWTRGASQFGGRPEVGVLEFTLDNEDRKFSPWNGVSAWNGATVVDDAGRVQPGYFAPGSLVRVVAFSPSGLINPLSEPDGVMVEIDSDWDTFSPSVWDGIYGNPKPSLSGGELVMDSTNLSGSKTDGVESLTTYPRDNSILTFKLGTAPVGDCYFGWGDYSRAFFRYGGTWHCGDNDTDPSFTPEGDWFRLRTVSDVVDYETSADGVTWTTHHSYSFGFDTKVYIYSHSVNAVGELYMDHTSLEYIDGSLLPDSPDATVCQFTGIVESWVDETAGLGADGAVLVTAVETISTMAKVDENAGSLVGNNDEPVERIQRLLDAAGWKYGDVIDRFTYESTLTTTDYELQSTDLAVNRITELYLTADSVGAVVRSDRSGMPVLTNHPETTDPVVLGMKRGPEKAKVRGLSFGYNNYLFDLFFAPYVADSVKVANDDEGIVNDVRLTYVGGSQRSDTDNVSIQQYGRVPYELNNLVCDSNDLLDYLISAKLAARARKPLRVASLQLHSSHFGALPAIIGFDVHDATYVYLPNLGDYFVIAIDAFIDSMTHRLTPLSNAEPIWTCDITFGLQAGIINDL